MPAVDWGASCRNGSDGIRTEAPLPRPHVALGPRIEELPRPEVLGVEGASPWSPSRSGSAGAGEVVKAGVQELENSIASRSPLSLSPISPSRSLMLPGEKPP